jgi:hypothetical protein
MDDNTRDDSYSSSGTATPDSIQATELLSSEHGDAGIFCKTYGFSSVA